MSLRSAIRANVLLARLGRNVSRQGRRHARRRGPISSLRDALIHPPAPTLVAVGGLSGTGKSVLARALAPAVMPQPGAVVLRSDVLRKQHFQVNETDRLPESAYRPEITEQIYEILVQRASRILAKAIPWSSMRCLPEAERDAIRDAARKLNVRFAGLFLVTDLATRQSASAAASAMRPTPRPRLPDFRRNMISARSIGRSSMPRERRSKP